MSVLSNEVWQVQNPAFGALLIWRFVVGYEAGHVDGATCPMPLVFLVLPTLLHEASARHVRSTLRNSGLRAFAAKFSAGGSAEADMLLELNDRASAMRRQSLDALRMGIGGRLLSTDSPTASVSALSRAKVRSIADDARLLGRDAEKFGYWCSQVTLYEIASTLKVRF